MTNYVLKAPLTNQKELIKKSFQNAMKSLPMLFDNNWDAALLDCIPKTRLYEIWVLNAVLWAPKCWQSTLFNALTNLEINATFLFVPSNLIMD